MKVIASRSASVEPERYKIPIPQCQTSSFHKSGSIKHRAMRFACIIGVYGYGGLNGVTAFLIT